MPVADLADLPTFLQSYDDLNAYIRDNLDEYDNTEKGRSFAGLVSRILPLSDIGDRFANVEVGGDGPDGGVDLSANSADDSLTLYGQTKLTIKKAEEIDTIISKFHNYYNQIHTNKVGQGYIPEVGLPTGTAKSKPSRKSKHAPVVVETNSPIPEQCIFLIATLSRIKGRNRILDEYLRSSYTSRSFYDQLIGEDRLIILDGPELFPLVQSAYRKSNILPSNVNLALAGPFLRQANVYIGIVSAKELKRCYRDYGEALFLDNIRLFLGYSPKADRESVNRSIRATANESPQEMLARNNGITFRATQVKPIDESTLYLERASIVNGCQTTKCIVDAERDEAFVLVKIVESGEAWGIAKAANSQTKVDQIVLELARYIRPQAVKTAASKAGYIVRDLHDTPYDVFNAIHKEGIIYDEIFYLFLGLFSNEPRNVINMNYTEVRRDLLAQLQERDPTGEQTLLLLFRLFLTAQEGKARAEQIYQDEYSKVYERFWKDNKADYRSLLTLLAACGCVRLNIYKNPHSENIVNEFLDRLNEALTNNAEGFLRYYCYAFEAVVTFLNTKRAGESSVEKQRYMYDDLRSAPFETLYSQLLMTATLHERTGAFS